MVRIIRRSCVAGGLLLLGACVDDTTAPPSPPAVFEVVPVGPATATILPRLPGTSSCIAWAISASGLVVGDCDTRAVMWRDGIVSAIPGVGAYGYARGVNDRDQIVLNNYEAGLAHFWSSPTSIDTIRGMAWPGFANDAGTVVGIHPPAVVRWRRGEGVRSLGNFGGNAFTMDVNNSEQLIASVFSYADGRAHVYMLESGVVTDIGSLGGGHAYMLKLSDRGEIAGFSSTAAGEWHAYVWSRGAGMRDLGVAGTTSAAYAVSNVGWVVGTSGAAGWPVARGGRATLWAGGEVIDLAGACRSSVPWDLNDAGQIVGECDGQAILWGVPTNRPPVVAAVATPSAVAEGDAVLLDASGSSDPDGDPLTFTWDFGDGTAGAGATATHSYADDGEYTALVTVTDGHGGIATAAVAVTVANAAPTLGAPVGPLAPLVVGSTATVTAPFADAGVSDAHTVEFTWGDGTSTAGTVSESSGTGSVSGVHGYALPGVYPVTITVVDDDGGSAAAVYQYVVVYDPSAGFVTGGGVIESPEGAYTAEPSLAGLAQFGFQSRYERGASVPTGGTQFRFRAAEFEFRSTAYQWLVVSGPMAKYKGVGNVNGQAGYGFMVTARDGQVPGGGGEDRFRLKVWDLTTGSIVYDNQLGADDDSDAAGALRGGQIQIHQ